MRAQLVVLSGADRGRAIDLAERQLYHVTVTGRADQPPVVAVETQKRADAQVEVLRRNDFAQVRQLNPAEPITLNGERTFGDGESFTLRNGDVIDVNRALLRLAVAGRIGEDVTGSGPYAAIDEERDTARIVDTAGPSDLADYKKFIGDLKDADKLGKRLECLQKISVAALELDDPTALLREVLRLLGDAIPGSQGAVMWRIGDQDAFRRVARLGDGESGTRVSRVVMQQVFETRRAVLSEDTELDARLRTSKSLRFKGMKSILSVPVVRGDRVAGVIGLDHVGRGAFSESDQVLVSAAAATVVGALDAADRRVSRSSSPLREGAAAVLRRAAVAAVAREPISASGLTIATALVGDASAGGLFAEVNALSPVGGAAGPGPVAIVAGEVRAKPVAASVGAVKAHTIATSLARYGSGPGRIIGEMTRALAEAGLQPDGSAIVARWEPVRAILSLAAASSPIVLHHAATAGRTRLVAIAAAAPSIVAPGERLETSSELVLERGDSVVLLTEGTLSVLGGGAAIVSMISGKIDEGPVAVSHALVTQAQMLASGHADEAGCVVAIRRD